MRAARVTVRQAFTCRLERGDAGHAPRATIDYPAGWAGLMPGHHIAAAPAGALEVKARVENSGAAIAREEAGAAGQHQGADPRENP